MRTGEDTTWLDRPVRRFEVTLGSQEPGTPMGEMRTFSWQGEATDEAHAVTVAMHEASAQGWTSTTSYRVCEDVAFLPVATEFRVTG
jgi:hypothetical protein